MLSVFNLITTNIANYRMITSFTTLSTKRSPDIICVIHRHRFTIMPYYEQGNSAAATVGKTL